MKSRRSTSALDVRRRPTPTGKFELVSETPAPKPKKVYHREPGLTKADRAKFAFYEHYVYQPTPEERWFRHSNWELKRALVRQALVTSGAAPRQIEIFDGCGARPVVEYCAEEQRYRIRGDYCRSRHCEPCARAKANLLAANLRKRLEERPDGRYRFITLTLRHSDTPLHEQIRRLYRCFRNLRSRPVWKTTQNGGTAILECKWSPDSRKWHPHLHIVAEGGYLKQQLLSAEWLRCTGDSSIVDIRQLESSKDAAHYVAKYVSKGTNGEVWHDKDARVEWVISMKGVRTAATFGTWRGFRLLAHDPDDRHWKPVGTLQQIIEAARQKETWAVLCLQTLVRDLKYDPHKPHTRKHESGSSDTT